MKVILSPAMNMSKCHSNKLEPTTPVFKKKTLEIVAELKKLSPFDLEVDLNISPKLVEKVFEYYIDFDVDNFDKKGSNALLAFQGLAYKNINSEDFTEEDFIFANDNLRVLSALYGVLKPSDAIQQYRLDFMCDFAKKGIAGEKLYNYWGDEVYKELFKDNEQVVAICSKEYEKLIKPYLKPTDRYISCDFLTYSKGKYKAFATASKMARGQMARYIIKNRIDNIEDLRGFEYDGFKYSEEYSKNNTYAFIK